MAGPSQNIEMEASKFLHKLIQDSKDEPAKLATKLYVILQHMKASGKELSMPYQVISRAMETVINQNGIDFEALKSSRTPVASGTQAPDSAKTQFGGSSQTSGAAKDTQSGPPEDELPKMDPFASGRPPVGPTSMGHDYFQGPPGAHRSTQSFDNESPSSLDSRSANSQSQEKRDTTNREKQTNKKEGKKAATKRKKGGAPLPEEASNDNSQQHDSRSAGTNPRKRKISKVESSDSAIKGGDHANYNIHPGSSPMEQFAAMSGSIGPGIIPKQEGKSLMEKQLDPGSDPMSRVPNLKFPEETEVTSSSHNQQVPSAVGHDSLGFWNQNKSGLQFEKQQVPRFSSNVPGYVETPLPSAGAPSIGSGKHLGPFGKVHGGVPVASGSFPTGEPGFANTTQFGGSNLMAGKVFEHDGGSSSNVADTGKLVKGGKNNIASMLRSAPRDTGKSPVGPGSLFREQQLKQLRAQCLVFLSFRNGLIPKKMHLDIAMGFSMPKDVGTSDGSRKELVDHKGKEQSSGEPSNVPEIVLPFGRTNNTRESDNSPPGYLSTGRIQDTGSLSKEAGNLKIEETTSGPSDHLQSLRKPDIEMQAQEAGGSQSGISGFTASAHLNKMENGHLRVNQSVSLMTVNKQTNPDTVGWTVVGNNDEVSRGLLPASSGQHDLMSERRDNALNQIQNLNNGSSGNQIADSNIASSLRDRWKPVPGFDNNLHAVVSLKNANMMPKHVSHAEQLHEGNSVSRELPSTPKYTMSEKWIMDHQKKRHMSEQKWVMKQQKTRHRMAICYHKLKENVSSSEDISTKTKSVIELKKLQLLELQRRLRSEFLNDYFKPIVAETERLRSQKKHKHGRRVKQLEKFEHRMKEERQKRIKERMKEFFGEVEVHKEKLDDVFKFKRERFKVFNKYAKEFHKRKERIHREKIDRIQREKINLLKINDVEGYLRMVQDAKSDRVKQLLKETEKYLQKLGSKLKEAKNVAMRFENEMEESGTTSFVDKCESAVENEDESDQAKHYMESNEKYYLMAHSVKESISDQPSCLVGGKLREYQMNGLRWLVSLYNNHLNGILADEMGLGKTVQVISLLCYLMETKNDRGPFLVVVPSSVLSGWESEINFWAPSVNKIVYSGPPEERRRLFKERIVHQKFNVLLTTYEYLMNKHDRPKLSKVHWHYIIIDEGHRIKNASCKLNSELKHYQSSHRLLLTGTPLQNNLEELWALLNFLLPNIFNSSDDFSQWFNKPFESNGDSSADQALLSEEENLLIINRLHQVLRPFVLRRLKHKVENELPEKIERLIRCEASAYQKLLMKRVDDNLGPIGSTKSKAVHNSVMEHRNICNHPYLSQLHSEEVDAYMPKHYLPPHVRLCGKLEMLDRLLPKLKATDHRILFFSTMTRLLDVMEEYLNWKQYRYLRLDGHTTGGDRGPLIDAFNKPDSPFFIFLLSIRAGGVGVNLQAADTVIIFDTDWNPQVDLQAQARAHRIGQKRDVLVLRFETVQSVEEQVRASAEHKLGVANQSITAGFFDNDTSAADRRNYLEALLRECKKEEAAPVLDDDSLNDKIARSESEIDVFESVDKQRREAEMATWRKLAYGQGQGGSSETLPPMPSRLVTDDDLKEFVEAMKVHESPAAAVSNAGGVKRKGGNVGGLDTQHYGRGKRAREVRSYEEQWTEEEFEKLCQADSPGSPSKPKVEVTDTKVLIDTKLPTEANQAEVAVVKTELFAPPLSDSSPPPPPPVAAAVPPPPPPPPPQTPSPPPPSTTAAEQPPQLHSSPLQPHIVAPPSSEVTPPAKRGRGRPKRATVDKSPSPVVQTPATGGVSGTTPHIAEGNALSSQPHSVNPLPVTPSSQPGTATSSVPSKGRGQGRRAQSGTEPPRRRGKRQLPVSPVVAGGGLSSSDPKPNEVTQNNPPNLSGTQPSVSIETVPLTAQGPDLSLCSALLGTSGADRHPNVGVDVAVNSSPASLQPVTINSPPASLQPVAVSSPPSALQSGGAPGFPSPSLIPSLPSSTKGQGRRAQSGSGSVPRRRGRKQGLLPTSDPLVSVSEDLKPTPDSQIKLVESSQANTMKGGQDNTQAPVPTPSSVIPEQVVQLPVSVASELPKSSVHTQGEQDKISAKTRDGGTGLPQGPALGESQSVDASKVSSAGNEALPEKCSSKPETTGPPTVVIQAALVTNNAIPEGNENQNSVDKTIPAPPMPISTAPVGDPSTASFRSSAIEGVTQSFVSSKVAPSLHSTLAYPTVPPAIQSPPPVVPVPGRRSGRKTPSRTDTPTTRRRGRKQQATIVAPLDGTGSKSVVLGGNVPEVAKVIPPQSAEAHTSAGLAGFDPKGNTQTKQPTNPPTTIDNAAGSSDKSSAKGRIQSADVNDVARVMKEIFSGTRPKSKMTESSGRENKVSSGKTSLQVAKSQNLEDKLQSIAESLESGAPGFDIPMKYRKHTGTRADTEVKAENSSLVSNTIHSNITEASKPEIKTDDIIPEQRSDAGQPSQEAAIGVIRNEEAISEDQPCVTIPTDSVTTCNELNTSSESPTAMKLDKPEPLSDEPPNSLATSGIENVQPGNLASTDVSDRFGTVNSGEGRFEQSVLPAAETDTEAVKCTDEGPESLSKVVDLGVGDGSSAEGNIDDSCVDTSSQKDMTLELMESVTTESGCAEVVVEDCAGECKTTVGIEQDDTVAHVTSPKMTLEKPISVSSPLGKDETCDNPENTKGVSDERLEDEKCDELESSGVGCDETLEDEKYDNRENSGVVCGETLEDEKSDNPENSGVGGGETLVDEKGDNPENSGVGGNETLEEEKCDSANNSGVGSDETLEKPKESTVEDQVQLDVTNAGDFQSEHRSDESLLTSSSEARGEKTEGSCEKVIVRNSSPPREAPKIPDHEPSSLLLGEKSENQNEEQDSEAVLDTVPKSSCSSKTSVEIPSPSVQTVQQNISDTFERDPRNSGTEVNNELHSSENVGAMPEKILEPSSLVAEEMVIQSDSVKDEVSLPDSIVSGSTPPAVADDEKIPCVVSTEEKEADGRKISKEDVESNGSKRQDSLTTGSAVLPEGEMPTQPEGENSEGKEDLSSGPVESEASPKGITPIEVLGNTRGCKTVPDSSVVVVEKPESEAES